MPRADDSDGDVTGRIGDSDAIPVVIGFFDSELDTDLVPVCDAAPDAVRGTRSFQQSFAAPRAEPNPNPTTTTTTSANPHTYAAAIANPHTNAAATASPLHHALGSERPRQLPSNGFGLQLRPRPDRKH
jgi:hypothetical protein